MMPMNLAEIGRKVMIHKVSGTPEVRRHLEDLGFIPGSVATVVTSLNGNLIVKVKETRAAMSVEIARLIMVKEA